MDPSDEVVAGVSQMASSEKHSLTRGVIDVRDCTVEEWKPSLIMAAVWSVLTFVVTVAGFFLFAYVYAFLGAGTLTGGSILESGADGDAAYVAISLGNAMPLIIASIGVLLLHEAVHGIGFWYFGGRPTFGAALVQKILPVLYCSAPGYLFSRAQFTVIILAPLAVISLLGILAMPFVNAGILVVVPLALNFGGAIGDLWMFGMLLRREQGTLIEDLKDGLRFHYPAAE